MVAWAHPSPQFKQHLNRFSSFCRAHGTECLHTLQWQQWRECDPKRFTEIFTHLSLASNTACEIFNVLSMVCVLPIQTELEMQWRFRCYWMNFVNNKTKLCMKSENINGALSFLWPWFTAHCICLNAKLILSFYSKSPYNCCLKPLTQYG